MARPNSADPPSFSRSAPFFEPSHHHYQDIRSAPPVFTTAHSNFPSIVGPEEFLGEEDYQSFGDWIGANKRARFESVEEGSEMGEAIVPEYAFEGSMDVAEQGEGLEMVEYAQNDTDFEERIEELEDAIPTVDDQAQLFQEPIDGQQEDFQQQQQQQPQFYPFHLQPTLHPHSNNSDIQPSPIINLAEDAESPEDHVEWNQGWNHQEQQFDDSLDSQPVYMQLVQRGEEEGEDLLEVGVDVENGLGPHFLIDDPGHEIDSVEADRNDSPALFDPDAIYLLESRVSELESLLQERNQQVDQAQAEANHWRNQFEELQGQLEAKAMEARTEIAETVQVRAKEAEVEMEKVKMAGKQVCCSFSGDWSAGYVIGADCSFPDNKQAINDLLGGIRALNDLHDVLSKLTSPVPVEIEDG